MTCYKCKREITHIRRMIVNQKNRDGSRYCVIACADCSAADGQIVRYRKANNITDFNDPRYGLPFPYIRWGQKLDACNYTCSICGKHGKMVIDHIVPLSRGGTNDIDNLQPLCHSCNVKKRNYTMEEFMEKQKNKHAVALGKIGGKKNTDAQNKARAANGAKGGRPKLPRLVCVETGKSTAINLSKDEPWENDEILDAAANKLLKRESEHKHDFVCISADKMRSEICHALEGLTEHTGEYRSFRIERA